MANNWICKRLFGASELIGNSDRLLALFLYLFISSFLYSTRPYGRLKMRFDTVRVLFAPVKLSVCGWSMAGVIAEKCEDPPDGITVGVKQTHRGRNSTAGSTPADPVREINTMVKRKP